MHYFLDSSALIKRYIIEVGTHWIRSITARSSGHVVIIAHITPVEILSGTMRRRREGAINPRTARAARLLIDRHTSREYRVVGLTGQVVQHAEDLLELHALRAYDAVQLASALESNNRLIAAGLSPLIFVSADSRLLIAATSEGLMIDDPSSHP
ncbi:MAG: type II toxin-antitoxin system VapC family toxin [Chloroflexi bacterium]|nr:type II toxin-antitoxin system VapC family toxin [Chloroflexota bacterium]